MDFLKQKRFICEITGHSGMSYFEAVQSEAAGSKEVDSAFPDPLKGPVLRRIQFSTISRIDNLVDHIFDEFKQDFYPGETVTVVLDDATRLNGLVREKSRFPEIRRQDGTIARKAVSRYLVKLISRPEEEALVDDDHIVRDRKAFTKQMLRSFIKNTVVREAWSGAPWLVKPRVAEEFRIDTNVPLHLQYGNRQQEKKEKAARKSDPDNMFSVWQSSRLPELKPATIKGRKQQVSHEELERQQWEEYQRALNVDPSFPQPWDHHHHPQTYDQWQANGSALIPPNGYYMPEMENQPPLAVSKPPPPPPIKYPIDDLEVAPSRDGIHRPALKFVAIGDNVTEVSTSSVIPGLNEKSVGLVLEIWNMLNVYCQVLLLDSFTFDDFLDAIQFSSDEFECDLVVEVHCAILKKLVNGENDQGGALQISLPDLPEVEEDEDEEEEEEEEEEPPTPEPAEPTKRSTRSSLNQVEYVNGRPSRSRSNTAEVRTHQANEIFEELDWIDRLRKRYFRDGGWQMILAGLLHQLSGRPRLREACDRVLTHLCPLDAEPTVDTIRLQYSTMDVNHRIEALETICMLFLETKSVKVFLEEMSATMTTYRKQKIEHQRARKEAMASLKLLHDQRRLLAPEEKSPTPMPELEEQAELERMDDETVSIADSEDEEPLTARSLRRGQDRALERKRKREEEQERKEKAAEAKKDKGSKEYQKVLRRIEKERDKIDEAEESILIVDNDLREADCPRTRCLGKDRFCNRYYWFERNAMPHGGLPDSSTAEAEYANGRIWVQGPDDMEREGFIDITEQEMRMYFQRFQMTPLERKRLEEGPTSVNTAHQWGFYETPEDLDMLIGWLDVRGVRELKLKKELNIQRDFIIKHMENRKRYLEPREDSEEPSTRMTTRTRTYVNDSSHRCLKWKNTAALEELGHRHIDPPPKPRPRGKKAVHEAATAKGTAVPVNRQGKPVTRQGVRYNF